MRLKSYFASTVEAAMALASKDLGEDAMLVYSREASPEARYLGRYEVVFALEAPAGETGNAAAVPPAPLPGASVATTPVPAALADGAVLLDLVREVAALRGEIGQLRKEVRRAPAALQEGAPAMPESLRRAEVDPGLAAELPGPEASLRELGLAMAGRIRTDARLGREAGGSAVVVVAGSHGSGKTTALVKMAAHYASKARRLPHLVSFDSQRVGAGEQLRSYANLIGATYQAATSLGALGQILRERSGQDLTLVDTGGYSAGNPEVVEELAALAAEFPGIQVHLALSAAMKAADQWRAVEAFGNASPARLILTRLDETGTLGQAWSLAARTGIAVSFLSTGPRLPEDWKPAEAAGFVEMVLGERIPEVPGAGLGDVVSGRGALVEAAPEEEGAGEAQRKAEWIAGALRRMRKPVWAKAGVAG